MTIGQTEAEAITRGESEAVRLDGRRLDAILTRWADLRATITVVGTALDAAEAERLVELQRELDEALTETAAINAEMHRLADDVEARTGVRPGTGWGIEPAR